MDSEQNDAQFLSTPKSCGNVRMSRKRHQTEGSDEAVHAGRVLIEGGHYGQPWE